MLSPENTALIKATVPVLQQHGEAITTHFYRIMFRDYPEVKAYFNQAHQAQGTQPRALANSVLAYAANIDRLEALQDALPVIIQKHVSLDIRPEHYPIVGTCLLQAIREVLGEAATDDIINAWAAAYGQLADLLIAAEEAVYSANEAKPGGWRGPRRFKLVKKQPESAVITSFYFEPEDGKAIMEFEPGQYLAILLTIDGEPVRRNYSLSCAPGEGHYRISVKREPNGMASTYLHDRLHEGDVVELLPPSGEFVLESESAHRPLVLLTGGVGITPALSMLKAAAPSGRPIEFVHAALNSSVHAFRDEVAAVAREYPNVRTCYVYSDPLAGDSADEEGFVSRDLLASRLPANGDADLYFVGPKPFMSMVYRYAKELELPGERVRYEFFGPAESLAEAV
ncbi:MAG: NO-inducible flavohemoprotein [Porticoccaceae bacterium]|nr:NO-inducible flavohemoprotein [Porticoccaceae bacterium]